MNNFYMIYIDGMRGPKVVHETIESARQAIQSYRDKGGTRQVYILSPCEISEGRKVLKVVKK